MTTNLWQPKGIDELESAARSALEHPGNACVVAGPGAGKTEFLAQKVAFLLETNVCVEPRRILAISFKKDASENLAARVRERCSEKFSGRFDSVTFDAFTKSILDRFQLALPPAWRPKPDYDIVNFNENQYRGFLDDMRENHRNHADKIEAIQTRHFQHVMLGTHKISTDVPRPLAAYLCHQWLASTVKRDLDFLVINRLADLILRSNPLITRAMARTYKYVLVDEFQDTTHSQYDFLQTLLGVLQARVTVVGDNKQRIMAWAGAKPDSFKQFKKDFDAEQFDLLLNHRSSPGLVKIHHTMALSLDPDYKPTESKVKQKVDKDIAEIWNFQRSASEASFLADWIKKDMEERTLSASDYALLVRQKADETHARLIKEFLKKGMLVCNETQRFGKFSLQDIVGDELFVFISSLFRVSIQSGAHDAWANACDCMSYFFPADVEESKPKRRNLLDRLVERKIRPQFKKFDSTAEKIGMCVCAVLTAIGEDTIRGTFPQHYSADNFQTFIEAMTEYLVFCAEQATSWPDFIDRVDRVGQVPLLTVHKSKGLEYDTVICLGLDDSAWWNYSTANPEGKATFFVGLSRAKQRVVFTYARGPGGRTKISELYKLLAAAGVPERVIA